MQFDKIIQSTKEVPEVPVRNLAELIFNKLDHRDENSEIMLKSLDEDFESYILKIRKSCILPEWHLP